MRPTGSAQELEVRRRIAARMLSQDYSVAEVAAAVGASEKGVRRWRSAVEAGGEEALAAKPTLGRPPRLQQAQKQELLRVLLAGARAAGFASDWWSCPRVAQVIERRFGVSHHPAHVWKLLRQLGWSCQKPEPRGRERDEAAIRRWRTRDWPRIKKGGATTS